ncbi:nitrate/nitrite transporter NrtS [uncultured Erythrobacter sp.]|uniref:nitrate/nitrite transporter NrtS n=1 Tax=uncultured Erythrobacter sp. TaxID=263913 RepID=UPI002628B9AF|nr:nitrate/nitrite transporter NrtS [uncultured Erythrobacter sp.]
MINRTALSQCVDAPVLKRSLVVSAIVGTILCAINQGDAILAGEMPVIWKVILTYIVPFCVATYGAYSACVAHSKMMQGKREVTPSD